MEKILTDKEEIQHKFEDRILDLIDNCEDYTRSDLQGAVTAIVMSAMNFTDLVAKTEMQKILEEALCVIERYYAFEQTPKDLGDAKTIHRIKHAIVNVKAWHPDGWPKIPGGLTPVQAAADDMFAILTMLIQNIAEEESFLHMLEDHKSHDCAYCRAREVIVKVTGFEFIQKQQKPW